MTEDGWRVLIGSEVRKRIARMPPEDATRILKALHGLASGPPFPGDVKRLRGRPEWRLRVGGWRVLFRIDAQNKTLVAVDAGPRGDVYK